MKTKLRKIDIHVDEDNVWKNYWEPKSVQDELDFLERFLQVKTDAYIEYTPHGGKILEAGCGLGRFVIFLRKRGYNAMGIDRTIEALSSSKRFDSSLPLTQGDVLSLPFPDNSFQALISNGVIEHFEEGPQQALSEAKRVLVDQGLLFLSIPISTLVSMPMYMKIYIRREWIGRLHSLVSPDWKPPQRRFLQYDYTRKETLGLVKEAGFEIIKVQPEDLYSSPSQRIGIHRALPITRKKGREGSRELNTLGRLLAKFFESVNPWLSCSHINCVARNRKHP